MRARRASRRWRGTCPPTGAASVLEELGHVEVAAFAQGASWLLLGGRGRPGIAARPAAMGAEARGDDGHPDLAVQPVVDGRAEDDVRVVCRGPPDHLRGVVDLDKREIVAA